MTQFTDLVTIYVSRETTKSSSGNFFRFIVQQEMFKIGNRIQNKSQIIKNK